MNDNLRLPVLIDTSVWIDYFRKITPEVETRVELLIIQSEIVVPKIVLAELIQGIRDKREVETLKEHFKPFTLLGEKVKTWEKAGYLSFKLKKKGITVNLTDCYISILAKEHHCHIYSLDKHFKLIAAHETISLWQ